MSNTFGEMKCMKLSLGRSWSLEDKNHLALIV